MSVDIVLEVQKKREFSKLPRSVVKRVVDSINEEDVKEKVKQARIILRKYFGVFLTNRVIKPKDITDYDSVLKSHKSSHKRDYTPFYEKIHEVIGEKVGSVVGSIIDLGCGMNGFSYPYIQNVFGNVGYTGIEASGQIVDSTNTFFETSSFAGCTCIWGDVFNTTPVSYTHLTLPTTRHV